MKVLNYIVLLLVDLLPVYHNQLYDMLDQLNAALMAIFQDELTRQNKQIN